MLKPFARAIACTTLLCALPAQAGEAEALRIFVERESGLATGRVEVSVGRPAGALQLAPCARQQPFVPPGARLWGRTMLGVRCVEGAHWQIFLPVHVRIYGPALVAVRPLAQGDPIGETDVRSEEVELTRFAQGALASVATLADKQMARPLAAGEPLLASSLRARQVVQQGDAVKVVYAGQGFTVSIEGRALAGALAGQAVRVAVDSGRTVTGIARVGRIVQMNP